MCSNSTWLTVAVAGFGLLTNLMLYALLMWLIVIAGSSQLGGWLGLGLINVVALL